jgi:hypothetical protein
VPSRGTVPGGGTVCAVRPSSSANSSARVAPCGPISLRACGASLPSRFRKAWASGWGSSFGGGHVLLGASRHPELAAAVAQCPFTDGLASVRALGLRSFLKVAPLAVRDELAAVTGRTPVRVALAGPPGSAALMTAPDAEPGYRALIPAGEDFDSTVAARIGTRIACTPPGARPRR